MSRAIKARRPKTLDSEGGILRNTCSFVLITERPRLALTPVNIRRRSAFVRWHFQAAPAFTTIHKQRKSSRRTRATLNYVRLDLR